MLLISCSSNNSEDLKEKLADSLQEAGVSVEDIEEATEALEEVTESLDEVTDGLAEVAEMVSEYADEMGISQFELEEMVHELSLMEAQKNSIGIGEYLKSLEDNGQTAFGVQKLQAETLGLTVVEFYDYQVYGGGEISEESEQNNADLANALTEASAVVVTLPTILTVNGNEVRRVEGDIDELMIEPVYEITSVYEDEYGVQTVCLSKNTVQEVGDYYQTLLLNTNGYQYVNVPGEGIVMLGMINDSGIVVEITDVDGITTITYDYGK